MRAESKKSHSISDALVNSRLVMLYMDPHLYGRALAIFFYVFRALEAALESSSMAKDETKMKLLRRLYRSSQFQKDLEFYLSSSWQEEAEIVRSSNPSLLRYEQHLQQLSKEGDGDLLIAHAYTQFMAVLSGGQILKSLAKKYLQIKAREEKGSGSLISSASASTQSFEYLAEPSTSSLKAEFKAFADDLGKVMGSEQRRRFLSEHLFAFRSNNETIRSFKMGYGVLWKHWMSKALIAVLSVVLVALALIALKR